MKKLIIFSTAIVGFLMVGIVTANAVTEQKESTSDVVLALSSSSSSYSITCYHLKRVGNSGWAKVTKHGTYDEDANTLGAAKKFRGFA